MRPRPAGPDTRARDLLDQPHMGASHVGSEEIPGHSPVRRQEPAQVIALASYRRRAVESERDRALDAAWNQLPVLVAEAWCWRDPDSVMAVEACVARLKELVREDWAAGQRPRKG